MSILAEAGELLASPLGSFVYYLLLLLAVQAILGMALDEWHRTRQAQAKRLLLVAAGLTIARLCYLIPLLVSLAGWASLQTWLPPLERFGDTVSIIVLGWAFASSASRADRVWDLVFGSTLALALAAGVGLTIHWSATLQAAPTLGASHGLAGVPTDYNQFWHSTAWSVGQMVLIVVACLAVVLSQNEDRVILLVGFLYLLLGRLLAIAVPVTTPNLPTWDRFANLISYPLFTIAIYQRIVIGLKANVNRLQGLSQASLDQFKSLLTLIETTRQASGSLDLVSVLDSSVQGIARALDADQCAIALPDEADSSQMRLAAIYNPPRQGRGETIRFPLEYQKTIQQAMRRKKLVLVEESDNVQLKVLFALLGSNETGPLLVQPLLLESEVVGAIILGNSRSRRPFTPHEAKLCESMAEQIAAAIHNARRYQAAQERITELHKTLDLERSLFQQANLQPQAGYPDESGSPVPSEVSGPPPTEVVRRLPEAPADRQATPVVESVNTIKSTRPGISAHQAR